MRVPAEIGDHRLRLAERLAADRARVRDRFAVGGRAHHLPPARVRVLEEVEVVPGVHAQHRFEAVRGRRLDREARGVDRGADALGPLRHLGRNRQAVAVVEGLARMVLPVRVRREREHHVAVARRPRTGSTDAAGTLDLVAGA